MDPIVITSAVTALATTVATKTLESPLKSINDLWDGIVGHTIAAWSEKRKFLAFQNVENFKQDLADEVNKIPIENIQEPQISIVGPTLEASKYYMDEKELRLMFAKIIAASMDSKKNGYVQHSFVEIIKQLTPLDALILNSLEVTAPIVNISMKDDGKTSTQTIHYDLFIHPDSQNNTLNSISINNLKRLGLINVEYDKSFANKSVYEPFKNSPEYLHVQKVCEFNTTNEIKKIPLIKEGVIIITNFGTSFKSICVN